MSQIATTIGKLAPVALVFGGGVVFARRKIIGAEISKAFSDFAFLFAIPCYLAGALYSSDLGRLFDPRAIAAYLVTALAGMLVVGFWSRRVTGADSRGIALRIMAGVQVNTTYFAIPVFVLLFGDAAPIFPIILLQVCVLTVVVIAVMEFGAGQEDPGGQRPIAAAVRGIRAAWLTYSVLIAAMPSPQNLFIFAQRYETDIDLAASIVAKTSLATLLLLPGWLLLAR